MLVNDNTCNKEGTWCHSTVDLFHISKQTHHYHSVLVTFITTQHWSAQSTWSILHNYDSNSNFKLHSRLCPVQKTACASAHILWTGDSFSSPGGKRKLVSMDCKSIMWVISSRSYTANLYAMSAVFYFHQYQLLFISMKSANFFFSLHSTDYKTCENWDAPFRKLFDFN